MKPFWKFLYSLTIVALIVLVFSTRRAHAQSPWNCRASYRDMDGDGSADLTILEQCQFATENDTIYIYDRTGNLVAAENWETNLDFENALWVFDAGSDGRMDLVIDFHRKGQEAIADLYDRQNTDDSLILEEGDQISIAKSHWTVRIIAPDGWWVKDDKVNFNLQLLIDGPVVASFDAPRYFDKLETDGQIDFEISVRDPNHNGHPDYEIIQSPHFLDRTTYIKTWAMKNEADNEFPIEGALFWPYLGTSSVYLDPTENLPTIGDFDPRTLPVEWMKPYETSPPPIQIEWGRGWITVVKEFVASHGGDHNWYIQSQARFGEDGETYANFENPYGFYDLADDWDGYPELIVRFQYYDAFDRYFAYDIPRQGETRRLVSGRYPYPLANIRYSWDQDNNKTWDYKVDLTGRHAITSTVEFDEFSVTTIPYRDIPYWVTDKSWEAVTFVAVENFSPAYWTSEGIYEWGPSWDLNSKYIPGILDEPPLDDYTTIPKGFRGEYNFQYAKQPHLYFSPIDRKLHLSNAQQGIWNLDDRTEIRYHNLDGDPYIDQWTYLEDGELKKTLIHTQDHLIYGDDDQVILLQVKVPVSLFETLPPRSHDEWQALGDQIEMNEREFAPDDFKALLDQFAGPSIQVKGASLRDFRISDGGFRTILELNPGYNWGSTITNLAEFHSDPGTYLLQYQSDMTIEPLTPPSLSIKDDRVETETKDLSQLNPVRLTVVVENHGLQDVNSLLVRFSVGQNGEFEIIDEVYLPVPGEGQETASTLWAPPEPGRWSVRVETKAEDEIPFSGGITNVVANTDVEVMPASQPSWIEFLSLEGERDFRTYLLPIMLFALVITAGALFILLLRAS